MSQDEARAEARRVVEQAAEESTSALLGEIAALLRRFVVMSAPQARVVALWAVHTHLIASCEATPYLAVTSPEKRSGKTRLLEVLELVVARPWLTGRTTAAVLPRKIDADHPTLLLDESDAAFGGDKEYAEALRGVLNTGHRRGGRATVCVGQGATIGFKDFSTFCPKAIAGIGKLPDTVADRAIPIRLARRSPAEQVDRFRRREVEPQTQQLRKRLAALTDVVVGMLAEAHPDLPGELDDRAWDGVEPLLAIADLAGGGWPITARAACVELYGGREIDDESSGVRLLVDVRDVFEDRDADRLATAGLLDGLHRVDEAPWGDWYGKPLSARSLAKMLRPYGVHSRTVRLDDGTTPKGYLREQFDEPWGRYIPSTPLSKRHNATNRSQSGIEPDFKTPQEPFVADSESAANPHGKRVVADVADRGAEGAGLGVQEPLSKPSPCDCWPPPKRLAREVVCRYCGGTT